MNVTINGVSIRSEFGIAVVDHEGKLNLRSRKGNTSFSFPDEHGEHPFVDDEDIRYESGEIRLTCVLTGYSREEFMNNYREFKDLIQSPGLHKLKIEQMDGVIHEVYLRDGVNINLRGTWKQGQIVSQEFVVPFVEPNPLAEAISFENDRSANLTGSIITSEGDLIIDRGDGTVETVSGESDNMDYSYDEGVLRRIDITSKKGLDVITEITLDSYNLECGIPYNIGKCKSLTTLNLSENNGLVPYNRQYWQVPDGITIDLTNCAGLTATDISNLLIDLANPRADLEIVENGTLTVTGCDGGTLTYSDLTAEGQTAYDDLETDHGWTMNFDS